jgi:hypothetical protein
VDPFGDERLISGMSWSKPEVTEILWEGRARLQEEAIWRFIHILVESHIFLANA